MACGKLAEEGLPACAIDKISWLDDPGKQTRLASLKDQRMRGNLPSYAIEGLGTLGSSRVNIDFHPENSDW